MNEEETKLTPNLEPPPRPAWRELFKTTEGRILLLGIAVALIGLIVMGLVAFWSPQTSRMIGAMSFTNIIFGRAVSMSIGYAGGYGHVLVVTVNIWVETDSLIQMEMVQEMLVMNVQMISLMTQITMVIV